MSTELTILGIALGLGLLVGLQKERGKTRIAGIRTFSLITIFGALTGLIANQTGQNWIIVGGLISITFLMVAANYLKHKESEVAMGQTTEVAALVMYCVGVYLAIGDILIGVILGSIVAILIYLKEYLSEQIAKMADKDIQAIMVFTAVTLVILPILPTDDFGPYEVLNLREIWLMVVLIVGISITGYFVHKRLGKNIGTGLNGLIGGIVSSVATTVTFTQLSSKSANAFYITGFVIIASTAVSYVRVIMEIFIVAPTIMNIVVPPILVLFGILSLIAFFLFIRARNEPSEKVPDPENPAQLKTAVIFGILYGLVLVLIAFVKDYFGSSGLYVVSVISGLTDMDAITLSLANTMENGDILPEEGWKYLVAACLGNILFKAGIVIILGLRKLQLIVIPALGIAAIVGLLLIFIW